MILNDSPYRIGPKSEISGAHTDWFSKALVELAASGTLEMPAHGYCV